MAEKRDAVSSLWAYAVVAWLVVSAVLLAHLAYCHSSIMRLRRGSCEAADPSLLAKFGAMCRRLGVARPALLCSKDVRSPLLTGLLRPAILLPLTPRTEAPEAQIEHVLAHELAHLARRDCLWNLLARMVCAVGFFQPLAWLLMRGLEMTSEEVADDMVLMSGADPKSYARDLTMIAERFLPSHRESVTGLGVVRFRSALGRRVKRILRAAPGVAGHLSWKTMASILVPIGLVTALTACLSVTESRAAGSAASAGTPETTAAEAKPAAVVPRGGDTRSETARPEATATATTSRTPDDAARERAIQSALDKRIEAISLPGVTLPEAIDIIKVHLGKSVNFVIDPAPLASIDVLFTLDVKDVSLREALELMLKPKGLGFTIWNNSIYISTTDGLREIELESHPLELRIYNVKDILGDGSGDAVGFLIVYTVFETTGAENWHYIQVLQTGTLEKGTGKGWATIDTQAGLMAVQQTPAIQKEIEGILAKIREAAKVAERTSPSVAALGEASSVPAGGPAAAPFVDDPAVRGRWVSRDFVDSIDAFKPNVKSWPGALYLKDMTFLDGGKMAQPWWTWTKGSVFHSGDKTTAAYIIKTIEGKPYLFFEWMSGDVTIRHRKPMYYVLARGD